MYIKRSCCGSMSNRIEIEWNEHEERADDLENKELPHGVLKASVSIWL